MSVKASSYKRNRDSEKDIYKIQLFFTANTGENNGTARTEFVFFSFRFVIERGTLERAKSREWNGHDSGHHVSSGLLRCKAWNHTQH